MPSLDVDQKSTCTAPGGGVKETKQYFEEEGNQINLGGLGPLFNNGTGDTEDREDEKTIGHHRTVLQVTLVV